MERATHKHLNLLVGILVSNMLDGRLNIMKHGSLGLRVELGPLCSKLVLHLELVNLLFGGVHGHEVRGVTGAESDIGGKHCLVEMQPHGVVEQAHQLTCVSGLLVEQQHLLVRAAGRDGPEPARRRLHALCGVCAVDAPGDGALGDGLAAAGPVRGCQAVLDLFPAVRDAQFAQVLLGEGHRQGRVLRLERAGDAQDAPCDILLAHHVKRDAPLCSTLAQHAHAGLELLRDSERSGAVLEDARLVPRNLLDGGAQHERVVDAQRGHAGGCGLLDDVRRVVLAAHTHLVDGGVDALAHEDVEREQREELEVGRAHSRLGRGQAGGPGSARIVAQTVPHLEKVPREALLVDGLAADADALAHRLEVRRGVQPDARNVRVELLEDALCKRARRALALGACDVDDVQGVEVCRGVAQAAGPLGHLGHGELVLAGAQLPGGLDRGEVGLERVERVQRVLGG